MSELQFQDRNEIEAYQCTQLRRLVVTLLDGNPFYGERLRQAGIDASISSLEQFTTSMPFTTKKELVADQETHPPFGSNLSFPIERYTRLHQTSSTTGKPLRWLDTAESWQWMLDGWVTVLRAEGVTPRDRLFAAFSFGPFIGFWLGYEAAQKMGCLVIPGGSMNSVTRLRAILENEATVLCCTPTYAIRLGQVARDTQVDLSQSKVRTIIVGGEPGGSLPAIRARLESLWPGARVFDHHGMTECGPATHQCPEQAGLLHLLESSLLCEFIHPETGEPMREDTDELSELVITTLGRTGSPLLRYRTGDLVRPRPNSKCLCGLWERVLEGGIIGRTDDMVFVRGVNLYPSAIDQIVRGCQGIVEYRVEIRDQMGMAEVEVQIEARGAEDPQNLCTQLETGLRAAFNLRIKVSAVPTDSLPRFELKARRWVRV